MKKIANIIKFIYILLIFYLTKEINILPLVVSFCMHMLYSGVFSTTSVKDMISNYHINKKYGMRDRIIKYSILSINVVGVLLIILAYHMGNILNIGYLNIINIFMTISVISNTILKIIKEYLEVVGYKKLSNSLLDIYNVLVYITGIIVNILLFKVFKLDYYINFSILYLINTIIFILFAILIYILIFKNIEKNKLLKKEKITNKINKILITNIPLTIYNIINGTYVYVSIIILYYVLSNKYNYSYDRVGVLISNTYFYGLIILYYITVLVNKYLNIDYKNIKNNFNNNVNKIIKVSLNLTILLIIISKPLSNIFINNNYNILSNILPLVFFYVIYNFMINININYIKESNTIIILIIGLIVKVLFEIPLINTLYRMGYSLILGSTISSIFGLVVSSIISIIFIKNKFKLNLLDNFNNILNIIYECIIYTLVVVLFTLVIKIDTVDVMDSILIVVFYIFITIIFHIVEKRILK